MQSQTWNACKFFCYLLLFLLCLSLPSFDLTWKHTASDINVIIQILTFRICCPSLSFFNIFCGLIAQGGELSVWRSFDQHLGRIRKTCFYYTCKTVCVCVCVRVCVSLGVVQPWKYFKGKILNQAQTTIFTLPTRTQNKGVKAGASGSVVQRVCVKMLSPSLS